MFEDWTSWTSWDRKEAVKRTVRAQTHQETTPTCITCAHNQNGRCKLSQLDMYEFRMMEPRFGGCGQLATKWQPDPRYKPEPEYEPRVLGLWQ